MPETAALVEAGSDPQATDAVEKQPKRARNVEYVRRSNFLKAERLILANKCTPEADIWASLSAQKGQQLVKEKDAFINHLLERGFGQLEGSKWAKRELEDKVQNKCVYLCEEDLLAKVHGNRSRADRLIQAAMEEGFGYGAGYYFHEREGCHVYKYFEPTAMSNTYRHKQTLETRLSTGTMQVEDEETHHGGPRPPPERLPLALQARPCVR